MREQTKVGRVGAVGCEELGRLGLVDTSLCCRICHSVEHHVPGVPLGPCRAPLPGGGEALVCCKGKEQLKEQLLAAEGTPEDQGAGRIVWPRRPAHDTRTRGGSL